MSNNAPYGSTDIMKWAIYLNSEVINQKTINDEIKRKLNEKSEEIKELKLENEKLKNKLDEISERLKEIETKL